MRHAKIQIPRNIMFLLTVIITSLTFPTWLGCSSKGDQGGQLLNRSKSAANLKVGPTDVDTKRTTETATDPGWTTGATTGTRIWTCASCGCANDRLNEICVGCGLNKQDLLNNIKKRKADKTTDANKSKSNDQQYVNAQEGQVEEACPVCLKDGKLDVWLSHQCKQCKKFVCVKCHEKMRKAKMNFCPLCRYKSKAKSKPTHRGRSNTL